MILGVLMGFLVLFPADAGAAKSVKILVLFSFHSNLEATDKIKAGLESRSGRGWLGL